MKTTSFAVLGPTLGLIVGVLASVEDDIFDREEQRTLVLTSLALALGIGRALWSLGPEGEMFEGSISRTLQPEGRPDSQTSYLVVRMLVHGENPHGMIGLETFAPYDFSSRGPVPGMASAPIVLMSGGRPELTTSAAPLAAVRRPGVHGVSDRDDDLHLLAPSWRSGSWSAGSAGAKAARFALLLGGEHAVPDRRPDVHLAQTAGRRLRPARRCIWVLERRPCGRGSRSEPAT